MIRKVKREDRQIYMEMVTDFYQSDAVLHPVPDKNFEVTFEEMLRSDCYVEGYIIEDQEVEGYALLSKSFSQESGGVVVWIEELYLKEEARGKGRGSQFFQFIEQQYPKATRFRLEVEEENEGAVRLYRRMGYEPLAYNQMVKEKEVL